MDQNDYYKAPESSLTDDDALVEVDASVVRDRLIAEQSYVRVFLILFVGAVIGELAMVTMLIAPGVFFLAYAIPGALCGLAVRLFGRVFDLRYRVFASAMAFLFFSTFNFVLFSQNPGFVLFASVTNAIVTGTLARRGFSPDEETAIFYRRFNME
ncbi:MAG: hypothetical protein AAF465_17265 [Pseudomonadota bacterium]